VHELQADALLLHLIEVAAIFGEFGVDQIFQSLNF
jgi:hypothetical protein